MTVANYHMCFMFSMHIINNVLSWQPLSF